MKKRLTFSIIILGAGLVLFQLRHKLAEVQHIDPMPVYTNVSLAIL